ncbi:hypothetical protein ACSBR2_038648 [Camellia fascicularis]
MTLRGFVLLLNGKSRGIEPPYSKALSVDDDEKRATKPIPSPPPPPMPAAAAEKHSPPAASGNLYWTADGLPLGNGSVMGEPLRRAQWDSSLFAFLGRNDEFCSSDLELASLFSIYGCCQYCNDVGGDGVDRVALDAEQGTYVPPALEEDVNMLNMSKSLNSLEEPRVCKTAGICSYVFQIIYQQQQQQHFKF